MPESLALLEVKTKRHPAIEDEDPDPEGEGSGSGGASGNGEDSSAPSFQLIHIVDGFSITHVIDSHNPVPPFAIFRKTDLVLDHTLGITFKDRVSKLKWDMAKKKAKKFDRLT